MQELRPPSDEGYRFPPEVISHAVWRYCRFALGYRDVEDLLAARGSVVAYASSRQWCRKRGQRYAKALRRRRPRPGDQWHRDAVFIQITGRQHSLWRAVDQDGAVRGILVPSRRDKRAAVQFLRKLLSGLQYVPRVLITDTHASYGVAEREMLPSVERRQHQRRNNRAEHAHQPTRARARRMRRCTSPGHAQRCRAASGPSAGHCRPRRHRRTAAAYRATRAERFQTWHEVTGTLAVA
jgi:putative transposase